MDKLITKLSTELASEFSVADEIFIAVALLNDAGLDFLLKDLKDNCKINLLVGIDLPTTPEVLKRLLELKDVNTRIYSKTEYFHPKLYVLKIDGKLKIFVGSSNFTKGGLNDNIELSVFSIDESACNDALNWFNEVFAYSSLLSKEFLDEYETLFLDRAIYRKIEKKNIKKIKGLLKPPSKENHLDLLTDEYFFVKDDYLTFRGSKIYSEAPEVKREREKVRLKMSHLEIKLAKEIIGLNWDIYSHHNPRNTVSLIDIDNNRVSNAINSVWLHFGRSEPELKAFKKNTGLPNDESFIKHMRLQVIISGSLRLSKAGYGVGIWLVIGKNNGSVWSRENIKDKLKFDLGFRNVFFKLVSLLGDEYFISVNDDPSPPLCSSFNNADDFLDYVKRDRTDFYFLIGKNYNPTNDALKKNNIISEIMNEFEKLYPLYKLLKM